MTPSSASNPFVGLRPFESDESLLFFGRQDQTLELLQRLNRYHFVAVTGGSGSGKSSIIKAGLIPRLKAGYLVNDNDRWVISVMKPGQSPLCNLADAILTQLDFTEHGLTATAVQEKILEQGTDAILNILKMWKSSTNFFLLIDQFEELFRFSMDDKDIAKKDEAIDFVNILLGLSGQTDFPVYVVTTMRSDFIGDCAQFYGLPEAMNQSQYIVPRLNRIQLQTTIEGPVRLYDGKINPSLTARLLNDAQLVKDELPLLQHVLMRIWDRENNAGLNRELTLEDYESIGGIEKALSNHADEALQGMSATELGLTKKIFQALTGIDENGRKIRRPAHMSELMAITGSDEETLLGLVNRFIEGNRSFLVINKSANTNDLLIDISHESLIRQWSTLNAWVDEEAESGKMYMRLSDSAELYKQKKKDLLSGNELQQLLQWYHLANPGKDWAQRYNPAYEENIQYLQQSEQQAKKQRAAKLRNRRLLVSGLILIILVISGFAFLIYRNYVANKKELALNYWRNAQAARAENNLLDGLHLIAEAGVTGNDKDLFQNLLIDGEAYLPQACLKNILPQNDIIYNATFSADDQHILIAGNDGNARIIDKITGKQTGLDMRHESPVNSAVFSPDGKWILTSGNDKTARIWEVLTGKQLYSFKHEDDVASAVFSPDTKFILTASAINAQIWEIATGKMIKSFKYASDVSSVVFSPDGTKILIASNDGGNPHLLDFAKKKEIHFSDAAEPDSSIVYHADFSHDGRKILTVNANLTVTIRDTTGKLLASIKQPARVNDAIFSPDDKWVLTANEDKTARLWNIATQKQVGTAMKHEGPVYAVAFSNDGNQVITGSADKTIRLWDIAAVIERKKTIFKHGAIINGSAFNPDGTKILTTGYDSTARIWNVAGKQIDSFKNQAGVMSALFSPDGTMVLAIGYDSTLRVREVSSGKQLILLNVKNKISCAAFSNDSKQIVAATYDNYVRRWNITANSTAVTLDSFKYPTEIASISFSQDGKKILISSDSSAHILDAATGQNVKSFNHDDFVTSAVFSPDGKNVLTASWDKTVRLWDVATQNQVGTAMKHDAFVNSAVFSPDGKWILTAGFDSAAHLWNRTTLKEVGIAKRHPAELSGAVFSPDGKWILTAGYDSTARLWEIDGDLDMPADLFKLQAQATTGVEYNIETGETRCLSVEKWKTLKEEYDTKARDHYETCKYPQYNLWRRFNKDEAGKIRHDEHLSK